MSIANRSNWDPGDSPTASLCSRLSVSTDAYISFKLSRGFFHNRVWYRNIQSSRVGSRISAMTFPTCMFSELPSLFRADNSSAAMISRNTSVSVPSRLRVRSSSHSTSTAAICSRNVSYARRIVTPRSMCATVRASSSSFGTFVFMSAISRPTSSTLCATSAASSFGQIVDSDTRSMSSSNECLSSFHTTTQYCSLSIGSAEGCARKSSSVDGTEGSSGE